MRRTHLTYTHLHNKSAYASHIIIQLNHSLCEFTIMLNYDFSNGFNTSHSLGKYSNNVFYGFSSMKCTASGILPISRLEKNEADDF